MEKSAIARSPLKLLRKPLFVALASGCLSLAGYGSASAALSLTTEQIFNFDFTNPPQPPGSEPPYTDIILELGLGGTFGSLSIQLFNDLNGTGGSVVVGPIGLTPPTVFAPDFTAAGLLDGKFSIGLQSSTISLNTIDAQGCKDCGIFETAPLAGTLVTVPGVPEPTSLALLGIAIAGLAATRRKRRP